MGVAVDVVDMGEEWLAKEVLADVTKPDVGSIIIRVPKMESGVMHMVSAIRKSVKPKSLWVMRMWGHGSCGEQLISAGHVDRFDDVWGAGINTFNFDNLRGALASLRPLFVSERARIELRGCIAGFGSFGSALMFNLAQTCGVRVHASDEYQRSNNWVGQVWEADPYGFIRKVHGYDIYGGYTPVYMPSKNYMY
jgi:hypothetical protein